jgi:hypothetical protein
MNPWEELLAHATRARLKDEHDLMAMIAADKLERLEEALARSDEFHDIEHKKMREVARKLQEENQRLRASLLEIIHKCDLCDKGFESLPCSCGKYGTIEEIARKALDGKE